MRYIDLEASNIVKLNLVSTSKGNQDKYYDKTNKCYIKMPFHYQGKTWKDYMVEYLSSCLVQHTDTLGVQVVQQEIIQTSKGPACISQDFASSDAEWVSIYSLCNGIIPNKYYGFSYHIFQWLRDVVKDKCNLDITNYLLVMIVLDYLLLNEDRHFNNFGILYSNGHWSVAPLFDFGLGLFEHDRRYESKTLEQALSLTQCKPFAPEYDAAIEMLFNAGYVSKISRIASGIKMPDSDLFPNELGYEYFCKALHYLKERCT